MGNLNAGILYICEFIYSLCYRAFIYVQKPKKEHVPFQHPFDQSRYYFYVISFRINKKVFEPLQLPNREINFEWRFEWLNIIEAVKAIETTQSM